MASFKGYDLIVVGSGFAGSLATLSFLEECKKSGKNGRVALVEVGKEGERCGASRWTMAYLRLDKNLDFGLSPPISPASLNRSLSRRQRLGQRNAPRQQRRGR
jgi:glycine/D-amino acid oxidase-like deaminating enzyme